MSAPPQRIAIRDLFRRAFAERRVRRERAETILSGISSASAAPTPADVAECVSVHGEKETVDRLQASGMTEAALSKVVARARISAALDVPLDTFVAVARLYTTKVMPKVRLDDVT